MVGYNLQNKEYMKSVYICLHCSFLLRDPVQLIDCGHRLCQSCADEQEGDMIICSECQEKTPRTRLRIDRGFKNDMQILSIICSLCKWTGILKNYQDHLNQMHPNPLCSYCGEMFSSVNDLNRHIRYNCGKITIDCPLKQFGCEGMILRINLRTHFLSEQHQKILINIVRQLKSTFPNIAFNHSEISSQMIDDLPHNIENTTIQQQEFYEETINILSDGVEILKDDLRRLSTESIQHQRTLDPLTQALSTMKISIQEQNTSLDGIRVNQDILQQDLATMVQKVNDMKTSSFDGIFIWKITNVQEKIADAVADKQTSIYSTPFYSSPTGYKMCLRMYLNGDGNARHTHISLFFVLMRGEYDAILKFPFHFKVIFCLYDQTNQQNHIIDAFRPDARSNSFQRPRSNTNIASGIPKFVSRETIQQTNNPYIRDDTMFIKVVVDFGDIPKDMLSYALNLNPGLTTSMQQTMIREETEKRQKLFTSSMTNTVKDQSLTVNL